MLGREEIYILIPQLTFVAIVFYALSLFMDKKSTLPVFQLGALLILL